MGIKIHKISKFVILVSIILIVFFLGLSAFADQEGPNRPHVEKSEMGGLIAKCFPGDKWASGSGEEKGKTEIVRLTDKGEELLCSFDWYTDRLYLIDNFYMDGNDFAIVRMGPWPQGREPSDKWLAVAFYSGCKEVKRYSTADIVRLGFKNPKNVIQTASHYQVFGQVEGFRIIDFNNWIFDILTTEGNRMAFNTSNGELRGQENEVAKLEKDKAKFKEGCDLIKGTLKQEAQEDGQKYWVCTNDAGSKMNFGPVDFHMK